MPSDQTLITAAVFAEVKPLVRRMKLRRERSGSPDLRWSGDTVTVLLTGMGDRAGACVAAAIDSQRPARVLSIGVAGALRDGLAVGDCIIAQQIIGSDGRSSSPTSLKDASGSLLTVDTLIASPDEKCALAESCGADAVDMETAHIAGACDERGIPWLSIRAISDTAADVVPAVLGEMVTDSGQPHMPRIIAWALGRPSRMKTLMRLGRDTRLAAERLADAVIDRL